MTMMEAMELLYGGVDRQGPGDPAFTRALLDSLPGLPETPRIADLGCGTGTGSLEVAAYYTQPVLCVDQSQHFLQRLKDNAQNHSHGHLLKPLHADMGALDPAQHRYDLLWSEGAAYNLTFAGALQAWHPLMATGGIAVISEMSWFTDTRPPQACTFWAAAYPDMATEAQNLAAARAAGFTPLFTQRLPSAAWWSNFYDPALARAQILEKDAPDALAEAIAELRTETALFAAHADSYGYTYYVLRA